MGVPAAELACVDDAAPEIVQRFARQEFLNNYLRLIVMLPFMVAMIVGITLFGENSRIAMWLVFAALAWALGVLTYHYFLLFSLKCPVCGWRFGRGEKCSSCGLSRHRHAADDCKVLDI